VLIDCSLCETYGESESLALEASSSDVGSLKIESKIIDLGYLGSQFTWRGQKYPGKNRVYESLDRALFKMECHFSLKLLSGIRLQSNSITTLFFLTCKVTSAGIPETFVL